MTSSVENTAETPESNSSISPEVNKRIAYAPLIFALFIKEENPPVLYCEETADETLEIAQPAGCSLLESFPQSVSAGPAVFTNSSTGSKGARCRKRLSLKCAGYRFASVSVQFSNPTDELLNYSPVAYAGSFN
jgi:hypothetical protein